MVLLLTHRAVRREDLVHQRRRGALRPSERERRSRNAFEFSVHWVISDCRVNTDDPHFLNPGSNNTLMFSNPIVGDWAPDFDRIEVSCTIPPPANIRPQDLFSWSSPGVRNLTLDGSRYFSIDSGSTNIVDFNQTPPGDFGDWLSEACPQPHPYVQNAFVCPDQFSDISATSPEGINLDVIGYDLVNATTPYLANLSTRAFVQTGDNLMIGGLIVARDSTKEGDSACNWP